MIAYICEPFSGAGTVDSIGSNLLRRGIMLDTSKCPLTFHDHGTRALLRTASISFPVVQPIDHGMNFFSVDNLAKISGVYESVKHRRYGPNSIFWACRNVSGSMYKYTLVVLFVAALDVNIRVRSTRMLPR